MLHHLRLRRCQTIELVKISHAYIGCHVFCERRCMYSKVYATVSSREQMRCWSTSQTVKNGAGHTGFSRNALAKTDPFAVHNSPVTNAVLDQQGTLAIRTVEMWTRLVLANLTVSPTVSERSLYNVIEHMGQHRPATKKRTRRLSSFIQQTIAGQS